MKCSICRNPKSPEILEAYLHSGSLRQTAIQYGVGYRSLLRHLDQCIVALLAEVEEQEFQDEFNELARLFSWYYSKHSKKPRSKSIIKIPIEFTWSKRIWKKKIEELIKEKESIINSIEVLEDKEELNVTTKLSNSQLNSTKPHQPKSLREIILERAKRRVKF